MFSPAPSDVITVVDQNDLSLNDAGTQFASPHIDQGGMLAGESTAPPLPPVIHSCTGTLRSGVSHTTDPVTVRAPSMHAQSAARPVIGSVDVSATSRVARTLSSTRSDASQMRPSTLSTSDPIPGPLGDLTLVDLPETQRLFPDPLEDPFANQEIDLEVESLLYNYDNYLWRPPPDMSSALNTWASHTGTGDLHPWFTHLGDDQISSSTVQSLMHRDRVPEATGRGHSQLIGTPLNSFESLPPRRGSDVGETDPNMAKAWATRSKKFRQLMPELWTELLHYEQENLFCKLDRSEFSSENPRRSGSRWGFDENCRLRLWGRFEMKSRLLIHLLHRLH